MRHFKLDIQRGSIGWNYQNESSGGTARVWTDGISAIYPEDGRCGYVTDANSANVVLIIGESPPRKSL